jgi:hypothetical protein
MLDQDASSTKAIVVTGNRPSVQNLIDRKAYSVSKDLQAGSGSAADVLRKIPSLDVDAQGAVSIRGDSNVQILIDGKPSTAMSSKTRADALEQLSASTIDHIEVITTPGAQFKPDASGGIINIVTKKSHKAGATGEIHLSAGTDGSASFDGTITYQRGRWTLTGNVNLRRDVRWRPFTDHRVDTVPSGAQTIVDQRGTFSGPRLARTVAGTLAYDATPRDQLSAQASYEYRTGTPHLFQNSLVQAANGETSNAYNRIATGHEQEVDSEISASFRHQFSGDAHQFTLDFRRGESVENENRLFHSFYDIPAGVQEIDEQFPRADELQRELTAEYTRPLGGGKLVAGYDHQQDDDDFRNRGILIDPSTAEQTTDPARTNRFHYRQIVDAWYANYDRSIATKLSIVGGLRLEETSIVTNQIDLGLRHRSNYLRAYPSLHIEDAVSKQEKLRLGYSRRIVRPDPEDLNPYPVFSDPLTERAGNQFLKPENIQAFEAEYERRSKLGTLDITAFVRRTANEFTVISRLLSPTLVLTTHENLGTSTTIGLDTSANGKLGRGISYQLSASVYREGVNASNLGIPTSRYALTGNIKGGLDLDLSKHDVLQIDANYRGRQLTPQGYRLPTFVSNIGVKHSFANGMNATLAISDLFNSRRDRISLESGSLREISMRRNGRRKLSIALTLPLSRSAGGTSKTSKPESDAEPSDP